MTRLSLKLVACIAAVLVQFSCASTAECVGATTPISPLILISLDGFAAEYWTRHPEAMPHLQQLRRGGVVSEGLIPVFPSNTFPNHYTIVTGLYPAEHGIVNNDFFDPTSGLYFRYTQASAARDGRWWGGEPIWVTAIKQGRKAATSFWVGSEAEIHGVRPTYWRPFNARLPFETRLAEFVEWLEKPAEDRPEFIAVYLEETNGAGHRFGPGSPELVDAIKLVDGRVGLILQKCKDHGLQPNVVIVSDHGMTAVDPQRVSTLEDYIDASAVQIEIEGSVAGLRPLDGDIETLFTAVNRIPHATAFRLQDLPPHLHMNDNPRLPPVWILPEGGAHVARRATIKRFQELYPKNGYLPGDHGYDPRLSSMHGLFVAHGPAFREGTILPPVENIHVYNLLCAVLGVSPAPNSGDDRLVRAALRH